MTTEKLQEAMADLESYARKLVQELRGAESVAEDLAVLVKGMAVRLSEQLAYARCEEGES